MKIQFLKEHLKLLNIKIYPLLLFAISHKVTKTKRKRIFFDTKFWRSVFFLKAKTVNYYMYQNGKENINKYR